MRARGVVLLLAAWAGCYDDHLVACGDRLCLDSQVCNLDAPELPVCEPPRNCGDQIVGYREACDGANLAGRTCTSEGFYDGELRCTNDCELDLSGCAGSCGDRIVQAARGELCDGDVGGSCVERGFDDGVLGCAACQPVATTCLRYGWRRLADVRIPIALAAAGGVFAVIDVAAAGETPRTRLFREQTPLSLPATADSYTALAPVLGATGPTGSLLFVGRGRIDRFDGASGQWSSVATPSGGFPEVPLDAFVTEIAGELEIWVSAADTSTVRRFHGGAWSDVQLGVMESYRFVPASRAVPPVLLGGSYWQWDATSSTFEFRTCIGESDHGSGALDNSNQLWEHSGTFVHVCKPTDSAMYAVMGGQGGRGVLVAPGHDDTMVVLSESTYHRIYPRPDDLQRGTNQQIPAPSGGSHLVTDRGRPYVAIPNVGIRSLTTAGWGISMPSVPAVGRSIVGLSGGEVVAIIDSPPPVAPLRMFVTGTHGQWILSRPNVSAAAGSGSPTFRLFTIESGQLYEDGGLASIDDPSAVFSAIWARTSNIAAEVEAAAVGDGVFAKRVFGAWETSALTFPLKALAGAGEIADLYAIGSDTSLYHYNGTAWSPILDLGVVPVAIWVSPAGTPWVLASDRIVRITPGTNPTTSVASFPGHVLLSISGLSDHEILVGGVVDDEVGVTGLLRYNGQTWYQARLPDYVGSIPGVAFAGTAPFLLATEREDPSRIQIIDWIRTP